jgi:hypothetical protein
MPVLSGQARGVSNSTKIQTRRCSLQSHTVLRGSDIPYRLYDVLGVALCYDKVNNGESAETTKLSRGVERGGAGVRAL